MKNQFEKFKALHHQDQLLLIGNVWNAQSAKVFEKLEFKAIATSSAAVAETLGYADGEEMSFEEYVFVVKRIVKSTSLPLSVDLEAGYGRTAAEIAKNIRTLAELGVSGINIEDSIVRDGKRSMADKSEFAELLKQVTQNLKSTNTSVFINLRCDTFLLGLPNPVQEAIDRIKIYEQTGVHGLFFPCITSLKDIEAVVTAAPLPVNVMCMPDLPGFSALQQAGVKRISMGNFPNKNIYQQLEKQMASVVKEKSFAGLFR